MDMKEFISGNTLNVEMVKNSPVKQLSILNQGEIRKIENKEKICFLVEFNGRRLEWFPNRSSLENLAKVWGFENSAWIGKPISLFISMFNGREMIIAQPSYEKV